MEYSPIMNVTKVTVFYNPDCAMYGIERKGSGQILPPKGKGARRGQSAYTHYKATAQKWADAMNKDSA